jgi:hypothetical protein
MLSTNFVNHNDDNFDQFSAHVILSLINSLLNLINFGINGILDFVHIPVFYRALKNTTFRHMDMFPSSDEGWAHSFHMCSLHLGVLNSHMFF